MRELIALAACLGLASSLSAQETKDPRPEKVQDAQPRAEANTAKDFVRFSFNFYDQSDGGGNPNLPEDMTVLEPQLLFSKTLSEKWTLGVKLQADIISAASIEKGKRFPAGTQSGATGDKYFGVDAGAFYAWADQVTVGGGITGSTEYDYMSMGLYGKVSYDTSSKNDTFSLRISAYHDTLDLILFDGTTDGNDTRDSVSAGFGWTHVFASGTVGTLNWDLTTQSGFLSTPYNSVVAAGTEVREVLPSNRLRNAVHARVRHLLFQDLAVEPGLGGYFDDWGATALNLEFALWWEAIPNLVFVRPTYRYHVQSEVDYFVPTSAAAIPTYRTQDSDLAAFHSNTFGLKFVFPRFLLLGEEHELELGFEYTMRSDDLDSFGTTMGYQWKF